MLRKPKSFLGTGWSFPPRFDTESENLEMVSDDQDIRESLYILMSTNPGERVTMPRYGCDLNQYSFKPINSHLAFRLSETIRKAILKFEPRVQVEHIDVDTSKDMEGLVMVTVFYRIITTNVRTNVVFPFYKAEGTEIQEI